MLFILLFLLYLWPNKCYFGENKKLLEKKKITQTQTISTEFLAIMIPYLESGKIVSNDALLPDILSCFGRFW